MICNNSVNIFLIGLVSSMKTDIRTTNVDQQPLMTFAYVFSVTIMVVFALLSNILSANTFYRAQIRSTSVGFHLLLYSCCSISVLLLLEIRLIQLLDSLNYESFFSICNVITPISSILTRICLWMNGFIGLQRALQSLELGFLWNKIRSRVAGIILVIVISICVSSMHVPELMSKRTLPDPVIAGKFVCQIRYSEELLALNTIFSFIHVFVPVSLNMLANCLILASISRRKANIHRTRYWSQWIRQFHRHGHLFISPTLTIACILPQLVLTLLFSCVNINTNNATEYHFNILSNIADVVEQTDLDLIVLEIATLAKKYPTLSANQVIQILLLREDLTKQEATDI
ncbi:unnamed protein product [Rotaria sp. Silwood1]|nr:unnamed protein product [Rotaria sp. Silwood1]CAF1678503.1 unnamed protein product [Rotaria sp. Silwood1]